MVPFDRHSSFPQAIDALFKETNYPFKLIVVEGNSPEPVRRELEKRKRKHKNIQILYSTHTPRLAEAFNLGLIHIRTSHAFLMHNGLLVTPGWLNSLMEQARTREGVFCPYIARKDKDAFPLIHAFLAAKELLEDIGLFDESVSTALSGVDLTHRFKSKGIPLHQDPYTILEYRNGLPARGGDLKLFKHQWHDPHAHQTLAYLKQKWGVAPDEAQYRDWLEKKHLRPAKTAVFTLPQARSADLPDLKRFMRVLHKA